jgi:hypothetical protein
MNCEHCGHDLKIHETTRLIKYVHDEPQRLINKCHEISCLMKALQDGEIACTKIWTEETAVDPVFNMIPEPDPGPKPIEYLEYDPEMEDPVQRGCIID